MIPLSGGILPRRLCWFSCGAASAVATKITVSEDSSSPSVIVYTKIKEEHSDNQRFIEACRAWFSQDITIVSNEKYHGSIYEVFTRERYLVGPAGAPCTKRLKRQVREQFSQKNDVHILGYTSEESDRAETFQDNNPDLVCRFPLIERQLTKSDCLAMIRDAGIALPAMYLLGYEHNNCIGCCKGGMGYWNKIRIDFPDVFARMAATEREIGATIIRSNGEPLYLDELDPSAGRGQREPHIECGVFCEQAKQEYGG